MDEGKPRSTLDRGAGHRPLPCIRRTRQTSSFSPRSAVRVDAVSVDSVSVYERLSRCEGDLGVTHEPGDERRCIAAPLRTRSEAARAALGAWDGEWCRGRSFVHAGLSSSRVSGVAPSICPVEDYG
ncbi:hypothetical protein E1301_Tti019208 [Triplophysa tibetana]|uniref:Uncharacterized protein n=1 Tax=Triplophysa tibetana TaxID=1572043 RepID=A0A5A9P8Y3_9TELE|nr:hypothetical protein E1301_Tti019208 [Triplophysa tibetana]